MLGVLGGLAVDAHLIDAVIGLSVVYKAFENLGGFREVLGIEPDTRVAVVVFGLFHGLGLATRLQDMTLSADGLVTNLLSFNLGVELGQVLAPVQLSMQTRCAQKRLSGQPEMELVLRPARVPHRARFALLSKSQRIDYQAS